MSNQRYSPEFKDEAVRQIVAREHDWMLVRELAQPGPQGDPQEGALPQRCCVHQIDFPGAEKYHGEVETPPKEWHAARALFAIQFGDRFVLAA